MRTIALCGTFLSAVFLLNACGGSKHQKQNEQEKLAEPEPEPQTEQSEEESKSSAKEHTKQTSQTPQTPVKSTPTPKKDPSPVPVPKTNNSIFGQIVEPNQSSIQQKLVNVYCVPCHQGNDPPAYLNLEDLSVFVGGDLGAGGFRGVLIVPGNSEISTLKLVMQRHASFSAMPPADNSLGIPAVGQQQIQAVADWIDNLQ